MARTIIKKPAFRATRFLCEGSLPKAVHHGALFRSAGTSSTGTGNYSSGPWPARARLAVRCMGALRAKRRRYPSALRSQVRSFWPRHAHADPRLRSRRDPLGSGGGDPGLDTDFGAAGECRRDLPPAASLAGFGEAEPDARYAARTAPVILARL